MADEQPVYTVMVAGETFYISKAEIDALDIIEKSEGRINLIRNNESINAFLVKWMNDGKYCSLEIDGELFEVYVKTPLEQQMDALGFAATSSHRQQEVKAPMPGLVLSVHVREGQQLRQGDKVLILEAMKMENSIIIQSDAVVKKVLVKNGQPVEKNQVLIELE